MWRDPTEVTAYHLQRTHFDQFSAIFFQPLWCHTEALEEPKLPVKVPLEFQEEHGELCRVGKEAPNIEI